METDLKGRHRTRDRLRSGVWKGHCFGARARGLPHRRTNYHLDPSLADDTVAELKAIGSDASAVKGDVSDAASVRRMFAR